MYWPLLLLHICSATVGLLSGFMSMAFRKGSGLHAAAGNIFFGSMLIATSAGAILAAFVRPNSGNVMGSTLTFYLVATAWVAARRRERKVGKFDYAALVFALAIAAIGMLWGFQTANSPSGVRHGYNAPFFFVFASIALLFAVSDIRMIVRGGVAGTQRIARHLWRMSMGLMFATLSFYPGQAKLFPRWLRETNLLQVPLVLVIGVMLFWLYRVSARKKMPRGVVSRLRDGQGIAWQPQTVVHVDPISR